MEGERTAFPPKDTAMTNVMVRMGVGGYCLACPNMPVVGSA